MQDELRKIWGSVLVLVGKIKGLVHHELSNTPNTKPVVLKVVTGTRVDVRGVEAQAIGAARRARRRRPEEAVSAATVRRAAADVAGINEVVRIASEFLIY